MRLIFTLFMFLFIYACVYDIHSMIQIENNTSNSYYVQLSCNDSLTKEDKPKFGFDKNGKLDSSIFYTIKPYKIDGLIDHANLNSRKFPCRNDTLFLFFIKDSVMKNQKWDTITKNQLYDFKLGYTEKDLEKKNWIITID